jgi:HD-GYP domain-containing protein (c-di-GMP phosphodiesterase class II)
MTNESVYQPRIGHAEALAELRRNAGSQFDPHVVDVFCALPTERTGRAERTAA